MKKTLIFALALSGAIAYAQDYNGKVGINTENPKATLDISPNAENAKTTATTNEGILAPRLSKTRVANIAVPREGTLVYVTNEADSPISAYTGTDTKVEKITEKGYYYYNGEQWVSNNDTSIYNTNGTLSGDRTINGNNKSLAITHLKGFYIGSEKVDIYDGIDTDFKNIKTLFIDVQQLKAKTLLTGGAVRAINLASTTTTGDRPVVADANGTLKIGTYTDTSIYNNDGTLSAKRTVDTNGNDLSFTGTGKIGIGVATPTQKLDIDGSIKSSSLQGTGDRPVVASADGTLKIGTGTYTDTSIYNNDGTLSAKRTVDTNGNDLSFTGTGKIGIGVATPNEKLDVDGGVRISDLALNMANVNNSKYLSEAEADQHDRPVVADPKTGKLKIGSNYIVYNPTNTGTSTTYTLQSRDYNKYIYLTNATTLIVPNTLPKGFSCVVVQQGTQQITIQGNGVRLQTARGYRTRKQYSAIGIIMRTTTEATITGDAVQ